MRAVRAAVKGHVPQGQRAFDLFRLRRMKVAVKKAGVAAEMRDNDRDGRDQCGSGAHRRDAAPALAHPSSCAFDDRGQVRLQLGEHAVTPAFA